MVPVKKVAIVIPGEPRCLPWNVDYINLFLTSLGLPYDVYICTDTNTGEMFKGINNIKSIVEVSRDWQVDEHNSTNTVLRPLLAEEISGMSHVSTEMLIEYSKFRMLRVDEVDGLINTPNIGGGERKFLNRHIIQWIKTYACWLNIMSSEIQYDFIIKIRTDVDFNYKQHVDLWSVKKWLHEQLFSDMFVGYGDRCFSAIPGEFEKLVKWPFDIEKYVYSCPKDEIHWCDHLPRLFFKHVHGKNYCKPLLLFDLIDDKPTAINYRKRHRQKNLSQYELNTINN